MPYLAMDGNVYRVLARLLDIDEPFDTTAGKKRFRSQAEQLLDRSHPRLYNSAIMEFGALQCTPVLGDNCAACPLRTFCAAYEHGTAELLPLRKPRPKLRDRWFTYHVYIQNEGEVYTLIRRRENAKDIWFHLYEFPCEEHETEPSSFHLSPFLFQHVLSHQRLHARVIIHKVDKMPQVEDAIPVSWEELDNYAFSKLSLKVIDTLRPTLPR